METWVIFIGWTARLILILLLFLSIWSFAVMIDRYKVFKELSEFKDSIQIREMIKTKRWEVLSQFVSSKPSLQSKMMKEALHLNTPDSTRIDRVVKSYLTEQKGHLENGLTVLATLGANAPFIGLFGTVLGIIQAFNVLGQKQSAATSVMTGISEALVATAVGLFVAIPAVISYNIFSRKMKVLLMDCESLRDLYLSHLEKSN